jgi:hypothetical protein
MSYYQFSVRSSQHTGSINQKPEVKTEGLGVKLPLTYSTLFKSRLQVGNLSRWQLKVDSQLGQVHLIVSFVMKFVITGFVIV